MMMIKRVIGTSNSGLAASTTSVLLLRGMTNTNTSTIMMGITSSTSTQRFQLQCLHGNGNGHVGSGMRQLSVNSFNAPLPRVPRQGGAPSPLSPSSPSTPHDGVSLSDASLASSQALYNQPIEMSDEEMEKEHAERLHYVEINKRQSHV
jgi:hypothetical protein